MAVATLRFASAGCKSCISLVVHADTKNRIPAGKKNRKIVFFMNAAFARDAFEAFVKKEEPDKNIGIFLGVQVIIKDKSINLYFDARMIGHSGIGTQVSNVLKLLAGHPKIKLSLLGDAAVIRKHLPVRGLKILPFHAPIYSIQEQLNFPKIDDPSAILHIPHYNAPVFQLSRSVVVVHDLIHLQSEEFKSPKYRLYTNFLLSQIARRAKHIVTVSNTTREEFLKRFPVPGERISVIHNGLDHDEFYPATKAQKDAFRKKYRLPEKFLLTVGIGKRHKNIDFVISALAPLWKEEKLNIPLVMAGTGGILPDYVADEIKRHGVERMIHLTPFFDRSDLRLLYACSDFFVMPSLLEGFGFPLVEAMACKVPILSSNASCLPEIGGNAVCYFDPQNQSDFQTKLMHLMKNRKHAASLIKKGILQSNKFKWEENVKKLVILYESLSMRSNHG